MSSSIIIKPVGVTDITPLTELSAKAFYDAFARLNKAEDVHAYMAATFNENNLLQEIMRPDSYFYFIIINKEPAGYIKINFGNSQTELLAGSGMEIQRLYVLAPYQGQKLGEQLVQFAISQAQKNTCSFVWLGVWEHNRNAIRFYERQGFTVFGQHIFCLGADLQTDLLMKRMV